MFSLQRFKYDKKQKGTRTKENYDDITDIIPETPPKNQASEKDSCCPVTSTNGLDEDMNGMLSAKKKKRKLVSSSDEDSEDAVPRCKKTKIVQISKKDSSKKKFSDFISADSGSENDDDTDDSRLQALRKLFPEYYEDKLRSAIRSTVTLAGAIAVLSKWKCEDIMNNHEPSTVVDDHNSHSSFDSPIIPARRKNCLRLVSDEKEKVVFERNDSKRSSKRLGLSSSESECEEDVSDKPKGPFPRLSCVVTNTSEIRNEEEKGKEFDCENVDDAEQKLQRSEKEILPSKRIGSFYSKKNKSWKTKKDKRWSKLDNESLTMDNAADENFSVEDDFDSGSSDDEFAEFGQRRRRGILEFFQGAGVDELITMHSCSQKKAEAIIGLRPFRSWDNLVHKLSDARTVGSQIISRCADLLSERAVLGRLLEECRSISNSLAKEIEKLHCQDHMTEGTALIKAPETIPSHLELKPYQLVGLNWIALLHRKGVNGVLADEMGLGKTVQTIAFLAYLLEQDPQTGPHLVVVPSSTLDNWCREFSLWCPQMDFVVYRGSQSERRAIRVEFSRGRTTNVIVTTYNSAISTPEDRLFFRRLGAQYAVYDEGHMLKNMSSQRYINLMKIKAARRLLLTGTPLQNNLLELMSLLRFVMPHMFEQTTDTLIRIFSSSNSESKSKFAEDRIKDAKDIMQPFVLRRLKEDVLKHLPMKENEIVLCEMSEAQTSLYEETKERFRLKLNKETPLEMKNVFVELRKVANHPLLRRHHYTADKLVKMAKLLKKDPEYQESKEHLMVEDMTVMTDFELHRFCQTTRAIKQYELDEFEVLNSGKFNVLDKYLPQFEKEGCRVLIFSQFTMVLDIVEKYLNKRSHKFLRLDGSTPVDMRLQLIDQFDSDPSILVFLLSTKAGGLGVNLTAANVVILHDIDMNPYNDKQAEDRCHRLGQEKSVKILRLISKGTLEEDMLQLATNKLRLEQEMTTNQDESSDIASLLKKTLTR